MTDGVDGEQFTVGCIYEDCAFHPVFCTNVSYEDDELTGISLIDGSAPRSCSMKHCGPELLTAEQAVRIKESFDAYVAFRVGGGDVNAYDVEGRR
jgi:hypothetical protein